MIVVDISVITYVLLYGDKTPLALKVYERDVLWCVPPLWRHEFLNVLSAFVRQGGGKPSDAEQIWQRGLRWLGAQEQAIDTVHALRLATQHRILPTDAQYIALARTLGIPCITEKLQLQKTFPSLAWSMQAFLVT